MFLVFRADLYAVPKHEIFLTELIILSYPIWKGTLGVYGKKFICMKCKGDICHFVFLPATEYAVKNYSSPAEYAVKIIPRLLSMW
jgi:hypothetical protein